MRRVDVSWQFRFCMSDKKPCWALFMGVLFFESVLGCIYLVMFTSTVCPIFVFVFCLFVFIIIGFLCVSPDMLKGRGHVEFSGLVNIRCPSAIV